MKNINVKSIETKLDYADGYYLELYMTIEKDGESYLLSEEPEEEAAMDFEDYPFTEDEKDFINGIAGRAESYALRQSEITFEGDMLNMIINNQ